jgi:DNA-binding CsgD family transcriptional regulator
MHPYHHPRLALAVAGYGAPANRPIEASLAQGPRLATPAEATKDESPRPPTPRRPPPETPPAVRDGLRSILREAARALASLSDTRLAPCALGPEWVVVDRFDVESCEYALVRRVDPARALRALTPRERQVALLAARGHSNKVIAFDLRIAHSTVSVLLHRAAKKLGVTTRAELAASMRSPAPAGEPAQP